MEGETVLNDSIHNEGSGFVSFLVECPQSPPYTTPIFHQRHTILHLSVDIEVDNEVIKEVDNMEAVTGWTVRQ